MTDEKKNPVVDAHSKAPEKKEDTKADKVTSTGGSTKGTTNLSDPKNPGSGLGSAADVENKESSSSGDKQADYDSCIKKMEDVLKEYGNRESEIPLNHEYWSIRNQAASLRSDLQAKKNR